jgi:hypothetical protein
MFNGDTPREALKPPQPEHNIVMAMTTANVLYFQFNFTRCYFIYV